MQIEKKTNKIYVKTLSPMESYFLNILKRFFDDESGSIEKSRESIILESVDRAKEEIVLKASPVLSVNEKTGHVILTYLDVGAEPTIDKKTAFNKDFGNKARTVCEGNDPRLDHSNYYDKPEIDEMLKHIKKLSAGIKIIINAEDWIQIDGCFKATVTHNLNLNVESFNIAFYKDNESRTFDYKILSNNSFEVYSDEACTIDVILRQALVCTVAIPSDIREQIESNTFRIKANEIDIKDINVEIENLKNLSIEGNLTDLINKYNTLKEKVDVNTTSISDINIELDTKANISHKHNISDVEYSKLDILLKDFGNLSTANTKATVSLAKGTPEDISLYTGPIGELLVDTVNKQLVLQDGSTIGGIKILKENHTHSYNSLEDIPSLDLSNYYQKSETYSNSEVDEKFEAINIPSVDNIYTKSEIDEFLDNIVYMRAPEIGTIGHKVLELNEEMQIIINKRIYFKDILKEELIFTEETGLYSVDLVHGLNTTNLNVQYFVNNEEMYSWFDIVDENTIKIFSLKNIDFQIRLTRNIELENLERGQIASEGGCDFVKY